MEWKAHVNMLPEPKKKEKSGEVNIMGLFITSQ